MQEWDRLAMALAGLGVAAYTGYGGIKLWRKQQKKAAVGTLLLAAATILLPAALAAFGG